MSARAETIKIFPNMNFPRNVSIFWKKVIAVPTKKKKELFINYGCTVLLHFYHFFLQLCTCIPLLLLNIFFFAFKSSFTGSAFQILVSWWRNFKRALYAQIKTSTLQYQKKKNVTIHTNLQYHVNTSLMVLLSGTRSALETTKWYFDNASLPLTVVWITPGMSTLCKPTKEVSCLN